MYYFLSLLVGVLITVMVAVNGGLTEQYGIYSATVIIHIVGLILITPLMLFKREQPFQKHHRWFLYLGGALGVVATVFNNLAFRRISVSAIMVLGLFGQSISGLIIDQCGWLGMPKYPFHKKKLVGLVLVLCGIAVMIDNFELVAIVASFAAGISIIISRTLNAKLSEFTSVRISTFYNYLIGLVVSLPILFFLGSDELQLATLYSPSKPYIYFGGFIGVCVVLLSNVIVSKISAFHLSLSLFIGQLFAGILIDIVVSQEFSIRNLIGGLFVITGLYINLMLDRKKAEEK